MWSLLPPHPQHFTRYQTPSRCHEYLLKRFKEQSQLRSSNFNGLIHPEKKKNHLGPSRWITHLNHKLSFSGLSKHSGASEAEETLLRSRNKLLIFPKEIKDSQEHRGTCCKSQHLQGWRWSWFHPESPGARLPAQETQVLCQTTERILGNSCTCCPPTPAYKTTSVFLFRPASLAHKEDCQKKDS